MNTALPVHHRGDDTTGQCSPHGILHRIEGSRQELCCLDPGQTIGRWWFSWCLDSGWGASAETTQTDSDFCCSSAGSSEAGSVLNCHMWHVLKTLPTYTSLPESVWWLAMGGALFRGPLSEQAMPGYWVLAGTRAEAAQAHELASGSPSGAQIGDWPAWLALFVKCLNKTSQCTSSHVYIKFPPCTFRGDRPSIALHSLAAQLISVGIQWPPKNGSMEPKHSAFRRCWLTSQSLSLRIWLDS